ncbi:MAG: AraC family ligand binding domain-containing protein [Verrucomicrobiales bacterium]|nr:AraC family ligand binding domain-containing protein [Verrucomicrobiales bacterium]
MKRDIHLSETTERVVRASRADARDWLADAPVCVMLARHGIVHVGVAEVTHPYEVRRPDLSGTFMMVCSAGEGRVWLEGKWWPMRANAACLAPPHAFHAYRAVPRKAWSIAWVRYQEPDGALPIVNARAPVVAAFDGGPLAAAIVGLHREASGTASPAAMQLWVDLIQHYARTFAEPWHWTTACGPPGRPWHATLPPTGPCRSSRNSPV